MPNGYFQFKQFTVHQEACAMKVCTDACLFGAWVAHQLQQQAAVDSILDIGTGTGLLSLMLAQATNAAIDAVEIDASAATQAADNFAASPWGQRMQVYHQPVQQYLQSGRQYGLVVSNPPFFENDLKSTDNKRNLALHSEALLLEELFEATGKLAAPQAQFALLLPWHRHTKALALAATYGWHVQTLAAVQQTLLHSPFRTMLLFSRIPNTASAAPENIAIKGNGNTYTPEFTQLLSAYYLYL